MNSDCVTMRGSLSPWFERTWRNQVFLRSLRDCQWLTVLSCNGCEEQDCLNFHVGEHLVNNPWPSLWDSAARKVERAQVQRFDERLATQAWLLQKLWKSRTLHSSSFHANDFKSRKMCKRVGSLKVFTCGYPGPTMPIVLVCPKLSKYVNDFTAPNERRSE